MFYINSAKNVAILTITITTSPLFKGVGNVKIFAQKIWHFTCNAHNKAICEI